MPQISFAKNRAPINVHAGENLMEALLKAGLPVASSCNGDGVCAKCKVMIIEGNENLSPPNETEAFLKEKNSLPEATRISCQVQILGPIKVDTTYW